jgi:hypothetical protein
MKKLLILLFALTLVLGIVGIASAISYYKDVYDPPGTTYMWEGREISWTFDIKKDGFNPSTETVTSAKVYLGLRALGLDKWFPEYASLDVGDNTYSWEVNTGTENFGLSSLITLNTDGTAFAKFKATDGNFRFYWAKLKAIAEAAPVPEPATILLMGIGLLGLVGYSRGRFSKKS